jgi:hypothetical protein
VRLELLLKATVAHLLLLQLPTAGTMYAWHGRARSPKLQSVHQYMCINRHILIT